jgi:hypothetical protein
MDTISRRYDDGIPELTAAEWHAREAAWRRATSDRLVRNLASQRYGGGREANKVIDLESGAVFASARVAAEAMGPQARYQGFAAAMSARKPYRGRWFAWDCDRLRTPEGRAEELANRMVGHERRKQGKRVAA